MLNQWLASKRLALQERIAFLHKVRLRAFAVVLGLALAIIGLTAMISAPAWPFVAGAVAIAAVAVNKVAARLTQPVCIGCGSTIANEPIGQYGAVCPQCGTIGTPAGLVDLRLAAGPQSNPGQPSESQRSERAHPEDEPASLA